MPPLPEPIRNRVLRVDDDGVCLCLEDDRGARRLALAGGALAVGALALGFELGASALPGLLATATLLGAVLLITPGTGRRTTRLTLAERGFRVDEGPWRGWTDAVTLDGPWLSIGDVRLALHGEEEPIRDLVAGYVRSLGTSSRQQVERR